MKKYFFLPLLFAGISCQSWAREDGLITFPQDEMNKENIPFNKEPSLKRKRPLKKEKKSPQKRKKVSSKKKDSLFSLNDLPPETLEEILSFLPFPHIWRLQTVNKKWKEIISKTYSPLLSICYWENPQMTGQEVKKVFEVYSSLKDKSSPPQESSFFSSPSHVLSFFMILKTFHHSKAPPLSSLFRGKAQEILTLWNQELTEITEPSPRRSYLERKGLHLYKILFPVQIVYPILWERTTEIETTDFPFFDELFLYLKTEYSKEDPKKYKLLKILNKYTKPSISPLDF